MDNHNEELSDNKNDNVAGAKEDGHITVEEKENNPGINNMEDDIGPSKASRVIKGVFVVAVVGVAALVTLGVKWYSKSTPAVATVEETTEVATTEEDLNIKINNENVDEAMAVSDLLNGEPEMAGGEESNDGLAEGETVQNSEGAVDNKTKQSNENKAESVEASTIEITASQEQINADIKTRQEIPVETMDSSIRESLKSDDEAAMESIFNDEAYAKDIREHNNN
jgi:hypothetical protein